MNGVFFRSICAISGKGIWEKPMFSDRKIAAIRSSKSSTKLIFQREARSRLTGFSSVSKDAFSIAKNKKRRRYLL
jgi:hypothetical protein